MKYLLEKNRRLGWRKLDTEAKGCAPPDVNPRVRTTVRQWSPKSMEPHIATFQRRTFLLFPSSVSLGFMVIWFWYSISLNSRTFKSRLSKVKGMTALTVMAYDDMLGLRNCLILSESTEPFRTINDSLWRQYPRCRVIFWTKFLLVRLIKQVSTFNH